MDFLLPKLSATMETATVGRWLKNVGDTVKTGETLVELETDKITLEVPAPTAGVIESISVGDGETVEVGALLGAIAAGEGAADGNGAAGHPDAKSDHPAPIDAGPEVTKLREPPAEKASAPEGTAPSAAKIIAEKGLEASSIEGTGKGGRITKGDALAAADGGAKKPVAARAPSAPDDEAREERVRMSRLRQTIARRLKEAQDTAAMLTTFNEVDMGAVMKIRSEYRDLFEKKHGVKLGFMGFFVKACVQALKELPAVNGEIDGTDIVYKNYYNVGVAVGTERGLVVPVVRDADTMTIAEIEKEIGDLARSARDGSLSIESMQGGTFTITNGGIYGSLMSTPILNAPQSGILGMHKIQERPMVVAGKVEVRPMMYLALSYDHRIVDGREAVTFLVRVKESLEDPQRLVLDL
ncbi:2-oxoglutarate dehydrogenase complex dihydrolipoyllysine-residue succinyltransferase [Bauldia litoralis]|uniref:2-oxoglutarate dehydrogenase complex dihydrolipoyllysine-residue succinyltransferase n=1 Tax=Bauldia litoralis TaxID=665467 RepID=UPI003263C131